MQNLMLRLDAFVRRRRRLVIAFWVIVLLAAVPGAMRQSEHLSGGGFGVPGSQSQAVQDAIDASFDVERTQLAVVLAPQSGATETQMRAALDRAALAADQEQLVEMPAAARAGAERQLGKGKTVVVPLRADVTEDDATNVASDLRETLLIADGPRDGVSTHLVGQGALWAGMQDISKKDLEKAETTGFPIVLLILLLAFGSLAAAILPLALGVFSVFITGALIYLLSLQMDMSVFVTNMASMIGIGVAVDYSLFVLARYREEIKAGREPDDARARAMATSGVAVVFSGITVIVSLAGLWMIDNNAIRSMALGAILVVAVSLLASATLLPALIRALGHRAYSRGRVFTVLGVAARSWSKRRPGSTHPEAPTRPDFWHRWTARVTRRPVLAAGGAGLVLLVLAIPTLSLQTGAGALRQFPADYETRKGFEAAAAVTSPGESSRMRIVVAFDEGTAKDGANPAATRSVAAHLSADPGIARVVPPVSSRDGRAVLIDAAPKQDAEAAGTKAAVLRLRAELPAVAGASARVDVGGISAAQQDVSDLISGSMWKVLLFVLGLSFLVLLVLLRSIVLPLKAVLMNLLSVGAAYGVLVAVFQWGWLDGFMGFQSTGEIDTLTPPLVLAVVFGLSMDYEVFLLSRIRERFEATGDTRRAVAEGLAGSARTITSAALIMVAVFAVFIGTGVPSIKQIGLGCAVAIAVDASIVRLILVPAAMELLGEWNWWLPKPLARLLPKGSFEELAPSTAPVV